MTKKIVVIYHRNCADGFGAAWAAWKKFGKKAAYLAVEHQAPLPDIGDGKDVYFLDFFPSVKNQLVEFKKKNHRLVAIDHHISQQEYLQYADEAFFDLNHSGAVSAWKYFHPRKSVPKLLKYVEDGDLWHFKLAKSRELLSALDTFGFDFRLWSKLAKDFESAEKRKKYGEIGRAIESYKLKAMEKISASAESVEFAGHRVLAVNSPILVSEIGHILATRCRDFGIIWRYRNSRLEVSLRSAGETDVAEIAAKRGGGGHKAASGFIVKIKDGKINFPWKKIN